MSLQIYTYKKNFAVQNAGRIFYLLFGSYLL